ncbi:adenosylmethionine--8-amino-7-oxononanoate transaminase [Almyronema epifaneia]|uniref:Adenosylmethionine-8-amino-7-oxononanoate aminotransferase n=1 Tax=Almyronema epifaneia S1 TaxID=2991925 RepID=A0ABW6IIG0_9CYAN
MAHPHLWHPFTQAKTAPDPLKVKSGQGAWLTLEDGQQILDCISSWWVNIHGHAHPRIAEAIYQQAQVLEQVIFAGFTHDPAEQIATRLVKYLPGALSRVFFSDNGSTAVEVALKMAYQYWHNQRQHRPQFLAFTGAYHGDTFGAMAVGARSPFTAAFDDLLFQVEFAPFPATYWGDETVEQKEAQAIAQIAAKLATGSFAAIILEPLVQGAGGMRMCRPQFLQQLQAIARQSDTLLIFDEVMTGFGRTGDWFACTRAAVEPDLICLSKGLTGGFLPLAVTVCSEKIYAAFYSDEAQKALYHGHSFTANPLGCAAALASLDLLIETEAAFRGLEAQHQRRLVHLADNPQIERIRCTGAIAAMDLVTAGDPGYFNQIGAQIRQRSLSKGLLLRPLGNVLYLLLPYCITEAELDLIYSGIDEILASLPSV